MCIILVTNKSPNYSPKKYTTFYTAKRDNILIKLVTTHYAVKFNKRYQVLFLTKTRSLTFFREIFPLITEYDQQHINQYNTNQLTL